MQASNDRYADERERDELALRMIRHEARTCTIQACTGLSHDRIRRLYKSYAQAVRDEPPRRHRGKSPRQVTFFVRTTRTHFESSLLASAFTAFGLLEDGCEAGASKAARAEAGSLDYGRLFCDAYETHQQLFSRPALSFEHAWFLLHLLSRSSELESVRCRHCDSHYLRDRSNAWRYDCPVCKLKSPGGQGR